MFFGFCRDFIPGTCTFFEKPLTPGTCNDSRSLLFLHPFKSLLRFLGLGWNLKQVRDWFGKGGRTRCFLGGATLWRLN